MRFRWPSRLVLPHPHRSRASTRPRLAGPGPPGGPGGGRGLRPGAAGVAAGGGGGFSGAEIEGAIVAALHRAYADGAELSTEAVLAEAHATPPLSRTRAAGFGAP